MFLSDWTIQFDYIGVALLIGIISYGISIFLYVTSAQNLGATRSQILFSTAPFWGIVAAYLILNEPINNMTLIASMILMAGIIFSHISSHRHQHLHNKMVHIHLHSHDDSHHNHQHTDADLKNKHSHLHEHEEIEHAHEHYPDMHHRHSHAKNEK
jgi:hypothetical protein